MTKSTSRCVLFLVVFAALGCGTSRSTVPQAASDLPRFTFASLSGQQVSVRIVDHRAGGESDRWVTRVTDDVTTALETAGVSIQADAPTSFEVRVNVLRADFELGNWNGCAKLTGYVTGRPTPLSAEGERCVKKGNLWGYKTADNVTALAYRDALVELLSALDAQLR